MLEIVATAINREPKVLIVDEPFQQLEGTLRRPVLSALLEMWRDTGAGVLIASQDVRETLRLVDRAYIINEGKIITEGTPDYLLSKPND
jgi:lipopolysaccharide export system ATP-binding protein